GLVLDLLAELLGLVAYLLGGLRRLVRGLVGPLLRLVRRVIDGVLDLLLRIRHRSAPVRPGRMSTPAAAEEVGPDTAPSRRPPTGTQPVCRPDRRSVTRARRGGGPA